MKLFILKCLPLENTGGEGQISTPLQQLVTFEYLRAFLTLTGILGEDVLEGGAGVDLNSDAQWTKISLF